MLMKHITVNSYSLESLKICQTDVRCFLAASPRSHRSRCPHRSLFDSRNLFKNLRPYDREILRNKLLESGNAEKAVKLH